MAGLRNPVSGRRVSSFECLVATFNYSGFQIDELHHHNQNLVGTLHATSLLVYH
ncbi:MAG: hypothetical protein MGU50_00960 [Trichodesmium sp. MAG_R02]|nr:hypothetical protein [Trichodesmium sp. MAG_R02]